MCPHEEKREKGAIATAALPVGRGERGAGHGEARWGRNLPK